MDLGFWGRLLLLFFLLPSFRAMAQPTPGSQPDSSTLSPLSTDPPAAADPAINPPSPPGPVYHYREFSVYVAESIGYPQVMSDLDTQRLFLLGLRYTGRLHSFRHTNLSGNADLKPVALYSLDLTGHRQYTYGGGGTVGLQFSPRRELRWQPFFDVDGGLLAFTQNTPLPDTRRVNMVLEFGPGVYLHRTSRRSLKTGVWFFHFSNGRTVSHNPGFDSFMFYLAYTFCDLTPAKSASH